MLTKELKWKLDEEVPRDDLERDEQIFFGQYSLFRDHPHLYKNSLPIKKQTVPAERPKTGFARAHSETRRPNFRAARPASGQKHQAAEGKPAASGPQTVVSYSGAIFKTPYADTLSGLNFLGFKKVLKMTNSNMNREFLADYYSIQPPPLVFAPPDHQKKATLKRKGLLESCNRMYLGYSTANADELFKKDLEQFKPKHMNRMKTRDLSSDGGEEEAAEEPTLKDQVKSKTGTAG